MKGEERVGEGGEGGRERGGEIGEGEGKRERGEM